MNELENHNQDAQPNAGHEQDLDEMLDALNTEADQGRHTASFRPLIDFLKSHVQYLPARVPCMPRNPLRILRTHVTNRPAILPAHLRSGLLRKVHSALAHVPYMPGDVVRTSPVARDV
jgi:hypothetical protein